MPKKTAAILRFVNFLAWVVVVGGPIYGACSFFARYQPAQAALAYQIGMGLFTAAVGFLFVRFLLTCQQADQPREKNS